jgi:hypothetical protein
MGWADGGGRRREREGKGEGGREEVGHNSRSPDRIL